MPADAKELGRGEGYGAWIEDRLARSEAEVHFVKRRAVRRGEGALDSLQLFAIASARE